jgi:hypothetical protein
MPNSALLDVVFRAADDREFRAMLVADPDAVGRACRLDREEQLMIRGMAKYSFVPGRSTAFDRTEFSDLLLLFLKLAVSDALNDQDALSALGEIHRSSRKGATTKRPNGSKRSPRPEQQRPRKGMSAVVERSGERHPDGHGDHPAGAAIRYSGRSSRMMAAAGDPGGQSTNGPKSGQHF